MKNALQTKQTADIQALEKAIMEWDFSGLNEIQRLTYLKSICKETGLNIKLNPFSYIRFQGKVIPYLNAVGSAQLRAINKLSTKIISRSVDKDQNMYVVTVAISSKDRSDEAMGAVFIGGLRGADLANAYLKTETKAKRRATLSICGMTRFDMPDGVDEPVKQTKIEERLEDVTAKTETNEQPAFAETLVAESRPPDDLPPAPEEPPKGYVMRSGLNKGKRVEDLSKQKLKKWLSWYEAMRTTGKDIHPDVQDDAFHVASRLEEPPSGQ